MAVWTNPNAPRVPEEVLVADSIGEFKKTPCWLFQQRWKHAILNVGHTVIITTIPMLLLVPRFFFPAIAFATFLERFIKTGYPF
jgi:hypothetical protein|mmetsp:Transcript_12462/g.22642  ORF Transcript_12462/g.22642 Transcript_12462/m.22642 type:complete len:84 (+) Transcript_12462:368-619(+)